MDQGLDKRNNTDVFTFSNISNNGNLKCLFDGWYLTSQVHMHLNDDDLEEGMYF
jgi:hypothetical protein